MLFLKPEYFYMLLIPLLVFAYIILTNKSALERYFDSAVLEKLRLDTSTIGKKGRDIFLFLALIMMIVALARPVMEKGDVTIKSKSIDMMVALDVSKSMMAADLYPSRLAFAKKRFIEFVDSFKEANIGVIAFSSQGFLVSPMTQDSTTLKYLVNNLSLDSMSLKGTNLLIPIEKGKEFLEKSKDKIIILFTDGGDSQDFTEAINKATSYKESIYVYATATPEGAAIKDHGVNVKDKAGKIVISCLNESIKKLAFETNGAYIVASYDDDSVAQMVADIKKKFKAKEHETKNIKNYKELFYYPLILAFIFLVLVFHSLPKKAAVIMIALTCTLGFPTSSEAKLFDFSEISNANDAYKKGDFETASKHYKEVVKSNKSPESIYDLANAQYKAGQYEEAIKTYNNVTTLNPALQYKTLFNQGNSYYQQKNYKKAISAYEKAQKIQEDADLKHNLELAKKKLKEQEKKQQKKQDKDKKKDNKQDKDKNKESDKKKEDDKKKQEKKEKKEQEKKKQQESKQDKDKEKKKQQSKPKEAKPKKDEISKKEEKMWQQHLERMRPQTMPMKLNTKSIKRSVDEKPW